MREALLTAMILIACTFHSSTRLCRAEDDTPVDPALGKRVAELLAVGFERGPQQLANAERLYLRLKADAPDDPRIDYAQGLVLWKQLKKKEALEKFQAVTRSEGVMYHAAWKAEIWTCFVSKNDDAGYSRLMEFAKRITSGDESSSHSVDADVRWIGTIMATLGLTCETKERREDWLQAEAKLAEILPEERMEGYLAGKTEIHMKHAELESEIEQAREKVKQQRAAQLERKQARLQRSLDGAKVKREGLKKSAAEAKETFAEKTAEFQKSMDRLEKEYTLVDRRAQVLVSSIALLDQQVAMLRETTRLAGRRVDERRLEFGLTQLLNQRGIYQAECMRSVAAAEQLANTARTLHQAYAAEVDQYEKATGEIVKADVNMDTWTERALKQADDLKKTPVKPVVPKGKIQMVRSFRTYIDLDLNAERESLLESYGIVTPEGNLE
ncbi:hypothetical protein [Schlesneria sp. T3-172]|uniref:hypothetical protein n=1 Tax=Schlesneria sphaerica TaxID=3373610 RepID=UPI0037C8A496